MTWTGSNAPNVCEYPPLLCNARRREYSLLDDELE